MRKFYGLLLVVILLATGCVSRSISIETVPDKVDVTVNGEYKGKSPVKFPFTFYGQYEIILEKQGFKSETIVEKVSAPLYEKFPIDFFSEVVVPAKIKDNRTFKYELKALNFNDAEIKNLVGRFKESRDKFNSGETVFDEKKKTDKKPEETKKSNTKFNFNQKETESK